MTGRAVAAVLTTLLTLVGCSGPAPRDRQAARPSRPPSAWQVGFWAWQRSWQGRYAVPRQPLAVDDLYLQSQSGGEGGSLAPRIRWPAQVPPASRYWATWRFEPGEPLMHPDQLAQRFGTLQQDATRQNLSLTGIQIDFDCPTSQLAVYAEWLSSVRRTLPADAQLSVTALLDWFRPGTRVADVIGEVSEFVPQFYDVGPAAERLALVAERVDAARWAPIFNRFGVPYRIGINTFGRLSLKPAGQARAELLDLSLLEVLAAPGFDRPAVTTTPASERQLVLHAVRPTWIGWLQVRAGASVEANLPTPASVGAAYAEARKMGGFCAGVVFFRWPLERESTVLAPDQVMKAIGASAGELPDAIQASDGGCAAVHCADLHLLPGEQFPEEERAFAIHASSALEYFLPQPKAGRLASMTARDVITVRLPPYHGETRLYLGRAISKAAARFTLDRGPS